MDISFERLRKLWYEHYNVKFEIVRNLKYREAVFLQSSKPCVIRCMKINATPYLDKNIERYKFLDKDMNMYGSLGHFPNLPMFSFSVKDKREEMNEFNVNYLSYMKGFDFLLDIDNEDLELAYASLIKTKKIFDDMQIPAWYQFSGNKGFHVRIDYEDLPQEYKQIGFVELSEIYKKFAENFKTIEGIPDIDLSVFDTRRIAKTPYSVVYPNYLIALPLSDDDIENFSIKIVSLPYQLNNINKIYKRGLLKRAGQSDNIKKLFDKYCEV